MSKKYGINNTELEFSEIYYVDPVNGSDNYNGLSPQTAFKSIERYTIIPEENTACILSEGDHIIPHFVTLLQSQLGCTQTLIGVGLKTRILISQTCASTNFIRTKKFNVIRLVIRYIDSVSTTSQRYMIWTSNTAITMLNFYNVLFHQNNQNYPTEEMCTWVGSSGTNAVDTPIFKNCITTVGKIMAANSTLVIRTNCVYPTAATNGTNTTILVLAKTYFDSDFNIDPTIAWRNMGTGKNPDGTTAHIGVYGGEYAWNWAYPITISGQDGVIGEYMKPPAVSYQVSSEGQMPITIMEKLNDSPIRRIYYAVRNADYIISPEKEDFWQLDNQENRLVIEATNGTSGAVRAYTFSRRIEKIDVETTPVLTTYRMRKIKVFLTHDAPSENVTILASNNALDDEPVWDSVRPGMGHIFANTNNSETDYAVSVRVIIERADLEKVTLSEIKYAYE